MGNEVGVKFGVKIYFGNTYWAWEVARQINCLVSIPEALGAVPAPYNSGMVAHAYNLSILELSSATLRVQSQSGAT